VEPVIYIARFAGRVFIVIGVGILANLSFYSGMVAEAVRSPTLIYIAGILSLTAGLAILGAYRAWTADWRVVVTILGWLCVIGGIIRVVLPRLTASLATTIYSTTTPMAIAGIVALVLGGFLCFQGYRQAK